MEQVLGAIGPGRMAVIFAIVAIAVYVWSNPHRWGFYDHFVWQAQAWLDGRIPIDYPVSEGVRTNDYYQDVLDLGDRALTASLGLPYEPGRALIPFPPLPAVLLLPFVAVWGLATSGALRCAELVTHRAPAAQAAELFQLIDEQPRSVLLAVLDFSSAR